MRILITYLIILIGWLPGYSQPAPETHGKSSEEASEQIVRWLADLYDYGIYAGEDSLLVTAEVQNILLNEKLQKLLYPEEYTWEIALLLLERMELKKAFWYFIHLYPENKELVMKSIIHYDKIFAMDHVLLGVLYTYAMVDPEVCTLADGRPVITRPDKIEEKLRTVEEIVGHIMHYRAQNVNK